MADTRFKIQHYFTYGWDDFEREDSDKNPEDSQPTTYATQDEANTALYEFIRDTNAAFRAGHLSQRYSRCPFRIVPVQE